MEILPENEKMNSIEKKNVNKILEIINYSKHRKSNKLNITPEVCSEVYEIIHNRSLNSKIPSKLIELLDENRDLQYKTNIDFSQSINDQELHRETRIILSLIYRDYICDKESRKRLLLKDEAELKQAEVILREKYNPDNIFNRKNSRPKEEVLINNTNSELIKYKESLGIRFKNFIFKILHIKK